MIDRGGTSVHEETAKHLGSHEEPWPVLRVPFDDGHTAYVVCADVEDVNNVDRAQAAVQAPITPAQRTPEVSAVRA